MPPFGKNAKRLGRLIGLIQKLTLLHSERLKLCAILAFLSAVGLIIHVLL